MKKTTVLALIALTSPALAEVVYDGNGRVIGRTNGDSQGSTTFYDAGGRVSGRSSTDSQGTTTFYGPTGRKAGSITTAPAARGGKR